MKNKKKLIVVGVLVAALVVGGGGLYYANELKKEEQERIYTEKINKEVSLIESTLDKVTKEKDQNKKLEELKRLIKEQEKYAKGERKDERVIKAYKTLVEKLQKDFKEANSKEMESIQSRDLEKEDIKSLNEKIDALNKLKENTKIQSGVVYAEGELKAFNEEIDKLIKEYGDKGRELEKKEQEKKAAVAQGNTGGSGQQGGNDPQNDTYIESDYSKTNIDNNNYGGNGSNYTPPVSGGNNYGGGSTNMNGSRSSNDPSCHSWTSDGGNYNSTMTDDGNGGYNQTIQDENTGEITTGGFSMD